MMAHTIIPATWEAVTGKLEGQWHSWQKVSETHFDQCVGHGGTYLLSQLHRRHR
jgi:hypothetical protein